MIQFQSKDRNMLPHSNEFSSSKNGKSTISALLADIEAAKRRAVDSLHRAQSAPQPHAADNSAFITLYDRHLSDREALFATIRALDDAKASSGH